MKMLNFKNFTNKGFTLIELLVVIGVLGILAAGLLATVDPLEQFRKGNDTNKKAAAVEIINALSRYNAARGVMPWASVALGGDACNTATTPNAILANSAGFQTCLQDLVDQGEIKTSFLNSRSLGFLTVTATATNVNVCFLPESTSLKQNIAETRYANTGTDTCAEVASSANPCYWCAR